MATKKESAPTLPESAKKSTWYKALKTIVDNDIHANRKEYYFAAPEALTKMLGIAEKDRAIWYCLFNVGVSCVATLILIPVLKELPWYWAALWTLFRAVALGTPRFYLALHFSAHTPILKPFVLNKLFIEYFCCAFYGLPPGVYRLHHIVMHHKEDNIHPLDLSSTMPYQRDNFLHFLYYWLRFEIGIWVELPYYTIKKGYYGMFAEVVGIMIFWWSLIYVTYFYYSDIIALWVLLIPQMALSFLLMFGNFSQHIFVNPKAYEDDHQLTINLINTPYNQLAFNDGYHIIHHKYPALHWTQLPNRFISDRELIRHANANAINFNDLDYFLMGVYVFTGNLKRLAKHFVPISEEQSKYTVDDLVHLFKSRFVPIPAPEQ